MRDNEKIMMVGLSGPAVWKTCSGRCLNWQVGEPRQRVISSGSDEECGLERDRVAAGSLRIGSFLDTGVIFCLMASISRLRRRSRCERNPPQPFRETVCRQLAHVSHLKPCSFICWVRNRGENAADPQSAALCIQLRLKLGMTVTSWPSQGDGGGGQGEGGRAR